MERAAATSRRSSSDHCPAVGNRSQAEVAAIDPGRPYQDAAVVADWKITTVAAAASARSYRSPFLRGIEDDPA